MDKEIVLMIAGKATEKYRFQFLDFLNQKQYALALMILSDIVAAFDEIYEQYLKNIDDEIVNRIVALVASFEYLQSDLVSICRWKEIPDDNFIRVLKKNTNELCDSLNLEIKKILR